MHELLTTRSKKSFLKNLNSFSCEYSQRHEEVLGREWAVTSYAFVTSVIAGVSVQHHAPAALTTRKESLIPTG